MLRVEKDLDVLREEAGDLRDKSVLVDDLERSRSEVAMFAELQRIEGESKERVLRSDLGDLKRKCEEKVREAERRAGKEIFDKEEKWRREVKRLKEEVRVHEVCEEDRSERCCMISSSFCRFEGIFT